MHPSPVFSEGQLRHFRLNSIINEEGKAVVLACLKKNLMISSLNQHLAIPGVKNRIEEGVNRKGISKDQFEILYPSSGDVNIDKLDLTLLVFLIRQLHPSLKHKNKVWSEPRRENLSMEADITRLKQKRNTFSHSGNTDLSESEFIAEYQELEMILCRLVTYCGDPNFTLNELLQKLRDKKEANFDEKPLQSDVATSISSGISVGHISIVDDKSMSSTTSSAAEEETISCLSLKVNNVGTSTTSLTKGRKLSFKVKSYLKPFVSIKKKDDTAVHKLPIPERRKTVDKRRSNSGKCNPCCSCVSKFSVRASRVWKTNAHSCSTYRCKITGITQLPSGLIIVVDNSHNSVQLMSQTGTILHEIECPNPYGTCAVECNKFAVTQRKPARVLLYEINQRIPSIELKLDTELVCEHGLLDVKMSGDFFYVLCEHGDLHILSARLEVRGVFPTNLTFVSNFDITAEGDRVFLSHEDSISCLDTFGNTVWIYHRSNTKFKGICLYKNSLFVAVWGKDKLVKLTTSGEFLGEIGSGQIQSPWAVFASRKTVLTSQYMSGLDKDTCREIIKVMG